jgi:outer membrane protein assembly factor BamB
MNSKRSILLSLIALIVIVASTASPLISSVSAQVPPGIDEPWPSFGATPDNHRAVDGSGPKNMGLKWRYETDGPLSGSASLAYGNVYFGSYDGNYYCLDAESGALKWKYTAEWEARDTPCISGGKVYTGDSDGNFYCLDAYTGAVIWKTPTEKGLITGEFPPGETWNARSSPQVVDGKVYVGSTDFNIYCMDAATNSHLEISY